MDHRESEADASEIQRRALKVLLDGPALQWITVTETAEPVALGADDRVIECYFDPETDAWEVLILVKPLGPRTNE